MKFHVRLAAPRPAFVLLSFFQFPFSFRSRRTAETPSRRRADADANNVTENRQMSVVQPSFYWLGDDSEASNRLPISSRIAPSSGISGIGRFRAVFPRGMGSDSNLARNTPQNGSQSLTGIFQAHLTHRISPPHTFYHFPSLGLTITKNIECAFSSTHEEHEFIY